VLPDIEIFSLAFPSDVILYRTTYLDYPGIVRIIPFIPASLTALNRLRYVTSPGNFRVQRIEIQPWDYHGGED